MKSIMFKFTISGHLLPLLSTREFLNAGLFMLLPEVPLAVPNFLTGLFNDAVQFCEFCSLIFLIGIISSRALHSASSNFVVLGGC